MYLYKLQYINTLHAVWFHSNLLIPQKVGRVFDHFDNNNMFIDLCTKHLSSAIWILQHEFNNTIWIEMNFQSKNKQVLQQLFGFGGF